MRFVVTCDPCGHRMALRRQIYQPEVFRLICHECEAQLVITATAADVVPIPGWARLLNEVSARR